MAPDPQSTHLAEKLIKRLESVGMRTSYRELFDIFLSKTTNTRPVGIVFRRSRSKPWGGGMVHPVSPKPSSQKSSIPDGESFEWSADFLRSLSVKCREYEFERLIPLQKNQVIEKDAMVLDFLPRPNSSCINMKDVVEEEFPAANQLSSLLNFAKKFVNHCGINGDQTKQKMTNEASVQIDNQFLSNRTLCSLMEQAVGLIFLHRRVDISYTGGEEGSTSAKHVTNSDSGFAVIRKSEGEWSAPCFLEVIGSKSPADDVAESSFESVHMLIINKKELAGRLILGNTVKFSASKKQQRVNVLVRDTAFIANDGGSFTLSDEFVVVVKANEEKNQAVYSAMTPQFTITPKDVLVGELFTITSLSLAIAYSLNIKTCAPQELFLLVNNPLTSMEHSKVSNSRTQCMPIQ